MPHHLHRTTGLQFLRGNDLCLEVIEGKVPEFCLYLIVSYGIKVWFLLSFYYFIYLFSHEQIFVEHLLCAGDCQKLFVCGVLVCLGCYNQIAQTRGLLNSRCLCLTVLEAGSPGLWCRQILCLVRTHCVDSCPLTMSSQGRKVRDLSGVSFIRALIPSMRAPPPPVT